MPNARIMEIRCGYSSCIMWTSCWCGEEVGKNGKIAPKLLLGGGTPHIVCLSYRESTKPGVRPKPLYSPEGGDDDGYPD